MKIRGASALRRHATAWLCTLWGARSGWYETRACWRDVPPAGGWPAKLRCLSSGLCQINGDREFFWVQNDDAHGFGLAGKIGVPGDQAQGRCVARLL